MQRRLIALFAFDFICACILFVCNTIGFYESPLTVSRLAHASSQIAAAESPTTQSNTDLREPAAIAVAIAQVERTEAIKAKRFSVIALCVLLVNLFVLYPVMRRTRSIAPDEQPAS
jgi:hypothetical protein